MDNSIQITTISWLDKYKPTQIENLISNKKSVRTIVSWLDSFEKNKKKLIKKHDGVKKKRARNNSNSQKNKIDKYSSIIITGTHGVGKTVSLDVILAEKNCNIVKVNFDNLKSNKNSKNIINKSVNKNNILNIMDGSNNTKQVIVIDEIETITSSTEKNNILSLQRDNDNEWLYPIIFISNNKHNKLFSEIKKYAYEIKFYEPYSSDMKKILGNIAVNENMKFSSEKTLNMIIEHSQGDIRRLIYILRDLKYAFGNEVITNKMVNIHCETSQQKDIDYDLYKATDGLLYGYNSIDNCLRYYETEKVLLPLMIHQHYPTCILNNSQNTRKEDRDKQYELVQEITESLSFGDVVENLIYGDQSWNMQEIHGFYTCVNTSFLLCDELDDDPVKCTLKFATDLNKTSIKNINKKNIQNAKRCLNTMNVRDFIHINNIIRKLIIDDKIEECMKLFEGYDIKLEHIESLLKIDKIKEKKVVLSSKHKKEIIKYLT
jgi:DNA polymerase III delta prime subunit